MLIELFGGNKLRILFINSVYNYGSTGHIIKDLKDKLEQDGHVAKVAFSRYPERADKDSIIIGNKLDYTISGIGSRLFDNHGLMNKRATKKFIKEIDEQNFDVVHIHNLHGYYINYPLLFEYLAKKNISVVWTLHDAWPMTGHAAYDERLDGKMLDVKNGYFKAKYPISFLADRSERNLNLKNKYMGMLKDCTIVTPSKWLMGLVEDSYLDKYDKKIINNGIDLSVFRKKKVSRVSDKKMLLGVANVWEKRKGFDDFIELRSKLSDEYEIILVGLSKKQISILPKGVTGFERTDSVEQLVDLYNQADIFLNLTYEDNYPTTNLEALACGTPVVTYSTGGSPESAFTRHTSAVVGQGDIKALIEAFSDNVGRKPILNKADLSKNTMIGYYLNLYKSISNP